MMQQVAVEYETNSVVWSENVRHQDEKILKAAGAKDIVLKGDAAKRYLEIAHGEIWKEQIGRASCRERV